MNNSIKFKCSNCENIFHGNDFTEFCDKCNSIEITKAKKPINPKIIYGSLILFLLSTFFVFQSNVAEFEKNIPLIQELDLSRHNQQESYWKNYYENEIKKSEKNYWYSSELKDPMFQKDSTIRFLFFFKTVNYLSYKNNFWNCNYKYAIYQNKNDKLLNKKADFEKNIKYKHKLNTSEFNTLINFIGQTDNFPLIESDYNIDQSCDECIEGFVHELLYDEIKAEDFSSFIKQYMIDKKDIEIYNQNSNNEYKSDLNKYINGLSYSVKNSIKSKLRTTDYISTETRKYKYNGKIKGVGNIEYSFNLKKYNTNSLSDKVETLIEDYYSNNSLYNGAQPYSYCYGKNPYCTPPNGYADCSSIEVKAPFNSDVLVLIKKNNRVYSHGYIKAGRSYKFKLKNGNYQPFFYYGKGWNPNKFMKKASCGTIKGGFIKNELISIIILVYMLMKLTHNLNIEH